MGFGTLFIGYFLILNLTYYSITDVIAASVMLLGLYKLSPVNKQFKLAMYTSCAFLGFSVLELAAEMYRMIFTPVLPSLFVSLMSAGRSIIVCAVTVTLLRGIYAVAQEVDISELMRKARLRGIYAALVYALWLILELPLDFLPITLLAIMSFVTIIATLIVTVLILSTIYTAYMRICMPGDEDVMKDKPSRFAFVNEMKKRQNERAEKEAAERLEKIKQKQKEREKRHGKK